MQIAEGVIVPFDAVSVEVSRSSGPGGQHVNKTETRVTLRFPLLSTPSLTEPARERLLETLRPKLTKSGEILVSCGTHREREQNLRKAFERLERLLQRAWHRDPPRKATRPSKGAKERRLAEKKLTQRKKESRKGSNHDD